MKRGKVWWVTVATAMLAMVLIGTMMMATVMWDTVSEADNHGDCGDDADSKAMMVTVTIVSTVMKMPV